MDANPNRAIVEDLLRHTAWMRRLARRLVVDAGEAEDVVQDAWIAALEHPPWRRDAVRSWFERVLRNRVRHSGRSKAARRGREERASRGGHAPSTVEIVARAQCQRLLVECVLALDEPYRDTVLRRFFADESAEEIARHLGVPGSTVRNRLRRGLARLRRDLDERFGVDARTWLGALVPLAGLRFAGTAPVASTTTAAATGVFVMSQAAKLGAVAVLVLTGIGAVWLVRGSAKESPEPSIETPAGRPAPTSLATEPPGEASARVAREALPGGAPTTVPAAGEATVGEDHAEQAPPPPGTIELLVRRGEEPLAGCWVFLAVDSANWVTRDPWGETERVRRYQLDEAGTVVIAGLDPGTHPVGIEVAPGDMKQRLIKLSESRGRRVEIVLGFARLSGHIYDPFGRPVEGARVQVGPGSGETACDSIVWSNGEGYYEMGALPVGRVFFSIHLAGTQHSNVDDMRMLTLPAEGAMVVDHGRLGGLVAWQGVVRDRAGEVVRGEGRFHVSSSDGVYFQAPFGDPEGRFTVPLPPGEYEVKVTPPGYNERYPVEDALRIETLDVLRDVTMPGTTLRGKLVDGATGEVLDASGLRSRWVSLRRRDSTHVRYRTAVLLPDGSYRLYGVEEGHWLLSSPGLALDVEVHVRADDLALHVDLVFGE